MFINRHDLLWFSELIDIVSTGCGIVAETAKDRCKSLAKYGLLKYMASSLSGHRYQVLVFIKTKDGARPVNSWEEFDKVIKDFLPEAAETDLTLIRRWQGPSGIHKSSMTGLNDQETPATEPTSEKQEANREVESTFRRHDGSKIIHPDEDVKSSFVTTNKMSTQELVKILSSKNKDPTSSSSETTTEKE